MLSLCPFDISAGVEVHRTAERLRTDLGRSVGVTMVTQLVWLTWFTGPTFPLSQQPCNQKDTR